MPDPRIWPIESAIDTQAVVGPGSAIALAANQARADADITNDGDNVVYLARGHAAVMGMGQRLNPNGGTYHIGLYNLFLGDIYGIAEDETNLSVSEGSRP